MALPLMPVLVTGAGQVAAALPDVVKSVKANLPTAYDRLVKITGFSGVSPERAATAAIKRGDANLVQANLTNMVAAGVPVSFLTSAIPLLGAADVEMLNAAARAHSVAQQQANDGMVPRVGGPTLMVDVYLANQVTRACKLLGCTVAQLADLMTLINTTRVEDIRAMQGSMSSLDSMASGTLRRGAF